MVGLVRFELTTSCTPCKRATRLRYSPNNRRVRKRDGPVGSKCFFCGREIRFKSELRIGDRTTEDTKEGEDVTEGTEANRSDTEGWGNRERG